jgi:uncharacterized protein with GYD domain
MATFISTLQFTQQGVQAVSETTKRAARFKAAGRKAGVKITGVYWTLGANDGVLIFDAPDDETATAAMLQLAGEGNVKTTTARAYTSEEMDKILSKMRGG